MDLSLDWKVNLKSGPAIGGMEQHKRAHKNISIDPKRDEHIPDS